jgi:hypothetical protein
VRFSSVVHLFFGSTLKEQNTFEQAQAQQIKGVKC